jgi:hypothetical protein
MVKKEHDWGVWVEGNKGKENNRTGTGLGGGRVKPIAKE